MDVTDLAMHHTSNIPGLGDFSSPTNEDKYGKNRKWIRETDSDYVKLAKQGGHKGLLSFEDERPDPTSSESDGKDEDPAWLKNAPAIEDLKKASSWATPDYMHHMEFQKSKDTGDSHSLHAPFGTDNNASWERKKDDWIMDVGMLRRPEFGRRQPQALNASTCTHEEGLPVQVDQQEAMQVKSFNRKKNESTSMQKLLSFGYVDNKNVGGNDEEKEDYDTETNFPNQQEEFSTENASSVCKKSTRQTGLRGSMNKNGLDTHDTHFNIFGQHRYKNISSTVENMQSKIALF
ncbi:uncharacterized protein C7orf57 homolog [Protopterus annectens]|uniref:uncharacterized protein C7orf57 homolog n=1 Tax=Protopterus annectens TaxID=7888 RepID=UPI001CFBC146|nr:uncharacterized protein C7orf57 homolog [Protopterus annectens]